MIHVWRHWRVKSDPFPWFGPVPVSFLFAVLLEKQRLGGVFAMEWEWAVALIIVGIIVIVFVIAGKRGQKLREEGKMITRNAAFWESCEYLSTACDYQEIKDGIKRADLSGCDVSVQYDVNGSKLILFKSSHSWNAVLEWKGTANEGRQYVYELSFPAWKTMRYGTPYGLTQMNMLMTAVEKLFLSLDYDTTVQQRRKELKTRPDFI